jgi:hypothetical protein
MLFVPIRIAPYHTEELNPTFTLPMMVALGAINSAGCILGDKPSYVEFLKLGTIRSYDAISPWIFVPFIYNHFPNDR